MRVLTAECQSGIVFFSLGPQALPPPALAEALPAYGGTIVTEIACNWKVCVEHLLSSDVGSGTGRCWRCALRAHATVIEQVVPHTFLRTRLVTHVFGAAADTQRERVDVFKQECEHLQLDRNGGVMANGDNASCGGVPSSARRCLKAASIHNLLRAGGAAAEFSETRPSHYVHSWTTAVLIDGTLRADAQDWSS